MSQTTFEQDSEPIGSHGTFDSYPVVARERAARICVEYYRNLLSRPEWICQNCSTVVEIDLQPESCPGCDGKWTLVRVVDLGEPPKE